MQKYRLLAPGPVPIPDRVRNALARPALHHRTPQFTKILQFCFERLKAIFETTQPVFILSTTGSGGMESVVVNTLSPGDKVLCVNGGKFGERWSEICKRYGIEVHELKVEWGKTLSLKDFESALKSSQNFKAVLSQVCETSTATLFPIEQMAQLIDSHQPQALFMVDAITALGCLPLPMDEWKLDAVVAGSQKAFMLPTGLSFVALSEKAQEAMKSNTIPRFYLDLRAEFKNYPQTTHFSTPNNLVVGLEEVLKIFDEVGLSTIKTRCHALSKATQNGAKELGLSVFSEAPSPSVTAICLPPQLEGEKFRQWLEEEKNITVMGGQDRLKNKVLRVGHMGAISNEDLLAFFAALAEGLNQTWPAGFEDRLNFHLSNSKEFFL